MKISVSQPLGVSSVGRDSETCARLAAEFTKAGSRVLDVGTGTGYVGICLAKLGRRVDAVDLSSAAVRAAARNAKRNRAKMRVFKSDLLENTRGKYDLIVCNLPVAPGGEALKSFVRRVPGIDFLRPLYFLFSSRRLAFADELLAQSGKRLANDGVVVLTLSSREENGLFEKHGFKPVKTVTKSGCGFTVLCRK